MTDAHDVLRSAIYGEVVSACEPFRPEGPWGRFQDPGAYCCPADPDQLLASLCQKFRAEDLVRSGVAGVAGVAGEAGDAIFLAPALLEAGNALIALRTEVDQRPFEILTPEGCLSGRLPAVAALDDVIALREGQLNEPHLHVVFGFEQVLACRSVGLPAALATGLADVSRSAIRELFQRLYPSDAFDEEEDAFDKAAWDDEDGRTIDADDEASEHLSVNSGDDWLVKLHGWSLFDVEARLEAEIELIRTHFAKIENYLNRSLRDARVVFTSAKAREALEFALQHGGRCDVRRALLEMASSSEALIPRPVGMKKVFQPPGSFSGATSQLFEANRLQSDATVQKRAWDNYDETLEREVLSPLREEGAAEADPVVRSLKLGFAAQASLLHRQQAFVASKVGTPSPNHSGEPRPGISIQDVEVISKLTQGLVSFAKELRCLPPRRRTIDVTPQDLRPTPGTNISADPNP